MKIVKLALVFIIAASGVLFSGGMAQAAPAACKVDIGASPTYSESENEFANSFIKTNLNLSGACDEVQTLTYEFKEWDATTNSAGAYAGGLPGPSLNSGDAISSRLQVRPGSYQVKILNAGVVVATETVIVPQRLGSVSQQYWVDDSQTELADFAMSVAPTPFNVPEGYTLYRTSDGGRCRPERISKGNFGLKGVRGYAEEHASHELVGKYLCLQDPTRDQLAFHELAHAAVEARLGRPDLLTDDEREQVPTCAEHALGYEPEYVKTNQRTLEPCLTNRKIISMTNRIVYDLCKGLVGQNVEWSDARDRCTKAAPSKASGLSGLPEKRVKELNKMSRDLTKVLVDAGDTTNPPIL